MPTTTKVDTGGDEPWSGAASVVAAQPHLVQVLDASSLRAGGARYGLASVDEVHFGRADAGGADRRVIDGRRVLRVRCAAAAVSSTHARLVREGAGWTLVDEGSRNGTWLDGARIDRAPVDDASCVQIGPLLFALRAAWPTPADTPLDSDAPALAASPLGYRTLVPSVQRALASLRAIAGSTVPVLLLGPTGSGKEVLARAVHATSGRAGAFVAVNCGALPAALIESLLFGHARGAFSGAVRDEPGFLRAADGGTLFLDEIGDLPHASQAALLRVLQEKEVVPVGGTRPVKVDLRVVAATHKPLASLVAEGAFREDLLARLRGFVHTLSPLAERREDLGLVCAAIFERAAASGGRVPSLSRESARALFRYPWPMNVRELEQALAAGAVLAHGGVLGLEALPADLHAYGAPGAATRASAPPSDASAAKDASDEEPADLRARLVRELEASHGNVAAVARALGKAPVQIRRWLRRFGLEANDYRAREG